MVNTLYRRDLTAPQRCVLDTITGYAKTRPNEWVGLPPEYEVRTNWASAQRRVAARLVMQGVASALEGLCAKRVYGSWVFGWFSACQPECLYRGQSQHVHAIELCARAAAETPRSAELGESADGGPTLTPDT